jgi:hypothetical protein
MNMNIWRSCPKQLGIIWCKKQPFIIGKFLPKKEKKNWKLKNEVMLKVFKSLKWGIFILFLSDFISNPQCLPKNMERWLKFCNSYLVYIQIWLNLPKMIINFSTSSYGWSPFWLQFFFLNKKDWYEGEGSYANSLSWY